MLSQYWFVDRISNITQIHFTHFLNYCQLVNRVDALSLYLHRYL